MTVFLIGYGLVMAVMFFVLLVLMLRGTVKVHASDIFVLCFGTVLWPFACVILWKVYLELKAVR